MTDEQKARIDAMDYEAMLRLWRFAPAGHPEFAITSVFEYFKKRMHQLREANTAAAVAASKRIGW